MLNERVREMATKNLTADEAELLKACCECEPGKGVPLPREFKRAATGLIRKGFAWTLSSVFTVCIATDEGRTFMASQSAA